MPYRNDIEEYREKVGKHWPAGELHPGQYGYHGDGNTYRLDINESAFFRRQLEYILAKTYDVKYRDLLAFSLIPISNEAPSGATQVTWRQYTGVGFAKIIQDYTSDFPRIDTYGVENTTLIYGIGASYAYTVVEIRRAQMANVPIDQKKANFARRAIEQVINTLAWVGDTNFHINGLLNFPGITQATIVADGSGSSTLWANKTPDQVIRDLNNLVTAVINTTNGKEIPTDLLLPISNYTYISQTKMSTPSDKTILQFFLENQRAAGWIQRVTMLPDLNGIGALGTNRALVYCRDEDHLTLQIPQPYEQFPMDQKGMTFEVICHAETAGVLVYYPLAIAYFDGL